MPTSTSPPAGREAPTGAVIAVGSATETWHLSRYAELRRVAAEAAELAVSTNAEAMWRKRLDTWAKGLLEEAQRSWMAYVDIATTTQYERNATMKRGEPDAVEFDQEGQVAVVMWRQERAAKGEDWGVFEVQAPQDGTGQPFMLTTPFREVRLASLPKGTRLIRINDPKHAATAAMDEILTMILRDVEAFRAGLSGEQAWQRMRYQAGFYHAAVRVSAKSLPDDEYRQWEPKMPPRVRIEDAPAVVANLVSTSRAQRIVCLYLMSRFYADALSECEKAREGSEEEWVDQVIAAMTQARAVMQHATAGYQMALLAFARVKPDTSKTLTILHPFPQSAPVLAVLPPDVPDTVTSFRVT